MCLSFLRMDKPLTGIAVQYDGQEDLRREAEDYRVVLNEQVLDD